MLLKCLKMSHRLVIPALKEYTSIFFAQVRPFLFPIININQRKRNALNSKLLDWSDYFISGENPDARDFVTPWLRGFVDSCDL